MFTLHVRTIQNLHRLSPFRTYCTKMNNSVLTQKFNPVTGKLEWELQKEDYDYVQEVARAAFADMLHDEERNLKYNLALQKAIQSFGTAGKESRVLDIGTGTGLLAMMAAQANATSITACETFQPMAICAREVIKTNQLEDKIQLIPKRSTDITVGAGADMKEKANILVTEVFDTELIGEGAIGTFNHAHSSLLSEDSIVVPARATVFAQLVESQLACMWNRGQPIEFKNQVIVPPSEINTCHGNGAVHDVQLAQLNPAKFKFLTEPFPIFHFDWNSKEPIPNDERKQVLVNSISPGTVHAVLMWWTLDMDREGEIVLSCAPPWAHPEGNELPWRDHWMQAVYYLPSDYHVKSIGEELSLLCYHDEYSLWFGLGSRSSPSVDLSRPFCNCSVHNAVSHTRLGQLNDAKRNRKFFEALEKVVTPQTVCLTLGDSCLLGLMAAKLGARKVYAAEPNTHCRRVLEAWVKTNGLEDRIIVMDGNFDKNPLSDKVNLLVGEPVFQSSILPWHNLYFANRKSQIEHSLEDGVTVLPKKASIFAVAVEMKDLWKIRAPVRNTQKVDLSVFDQLIENAISATDSLIEPHPLWEYPSKALSQAVQLISVDITKPMTEQVTEVKGTSTIEGAGSCNGIALWMDWQLDEEISVSGGPTEPVVVGGYPEWNVHSKQGVCFLQTPVDVAADRKELHYQVSIVPGTYELKFNFTVQ